MIGVDIDVDIQYNHDEADGKKTNEYWIRFKNVFFFIICSQTQIDCWWRADNTLRLQARSIYSWFYLFYGNNEAPERSDISIIILIARNLCDQGCVGKRFMFRFVGLCRPGAQFKRSEVEAAIAKSACWVTPRASRLKLLTYNRPCQRFLFNRAIETKLSAS